MLSTRFVSSSGLVRIGTGMSNSLSKAPTSFSLNTFSPSPVLLEQKPKHYLPFAYYLLKSHEGKFLKRGEGGDRVASPGSLCRLSVLNLINVMATASRQQALLLLTADLHIDVEHHFQGAGLLILPHTTHASSPKLLTPQQALTLIQPTAT